MRFIGTLIQLQVQGERIKDQNHNSYDPRRIIPVAGLELSLDGAVGITVAGDKRMDVHHNHHPTSHSRGDNTLSICFTSHYKRARAQFGSELPYGCMGENLLVDGDVEYETGLPGRALVFKTQDTNENILISLTRTAPPCRPFSTFASGATDSNTLAAALRFLNDGGRGYYAQLSEPVSATLQEDAAVYLLE